MSDRIKRLPVILILAGVILGATFSCLLIDGRLFNDRREIEKGGEWQYYSINPETLLEALSHGGADVFTMMIATPEGELSESAAIVRWRQEDYFLIAQAIHEQSWEEPLGKYDIYRMQFSVNCSDVERGVFSNARFYSFKVVQTEGEEETRIEHWIGIWPAENLVYTTEVMYQPNVNNKLPIELSRYKITAEQALRIAEENGGKEIRLTVGNACQIDALAPGPNGKGWRVLYSNFPSFADLLFEIAIDSETGEYKVLHPKP